MALDLTEECKGGFEAARRGHTEPPYYHSSDSWLAWLAGAAMFARGGTAPELCRKSRGYSLKIISVGGASFTFAATGRDLGTRELVRVS